MQKTLTLKNGKKLEVRPLNEGDIPSMYDYLDIIGTQTIYTRQYPGRPRKSVEETKAQFENENNFNLSVWDERGGLVAMLGAWGSTHPWTKHIAHFGVHMLDEVQGQGLGRQMMQLLQDWAKSKNITRIEGEVRTLNVKAIALYLKCGFKIEGMHPKRALINNEWHDEYSISKIL